MEVVSGQRGGNLDVLCSKMSNEFCLEGKYSTTSSEAVSSNLCCNKYSVSQWEQMKTLSYRAFICVARDDVSYYYQIDLKA